MKKRLLAVSIAATLVGIGGISSAALTSTNLAPMPGGIWIRWRQRPAKWVPRNGPSEIAG